MLHEPLALRVARATNHAARDAAGRLHHRARSRHRGRRLRGRRAEAGDRPGIIPGPRMLVVTRAIVATGSYGPKGFDPRWDVPQGAEEADGVDGLIRVVREPDRPGRRLDQDLRRLPLGPERRGAPDVHRGGAADDRRDRAQQRPAGGRPRDHRRRACAARCWPASRRSSTATTARPEVFRLMAQKQRRALPDARRRRRDPAVPRLEEGQRPGAGRRSPPSARASRPRSPPA